MAFLMGVTGSLHCAGMCGPIIWIMPFQVFSGIKRILALAMYHIARVSVYALMALTLYSFRSMFTPKLQQYVSISLGAILLLVGILTFLPNNMLKVKLPWTGYVQKQLSKVVGNPGLHTIFIAGILNGLLPCGLVYMALSTSMTASTSVEAVKLVYMFGFGTIPMLVGITLLKSKMNFIRFSHIKKFVPIVVFSFGFLFVLRGLNLGIPYISPKLEVTEHKIKACCCHKQ